MSENCSHNCSTCSSKCDKKDFQEKCNEQSKIKKVIGVVSGKGGVGKSLVTSLLACAFSKLGYKTAVLDADITGPSIPKLFGINSKAEAFDQKYILPVTSHGGVKVMSINLLLENDTDPVVWRGPVIAGAVKQFWTDVVWGEVDYMFVDMPPGTGDVPLTVFQSLPIDGIVVVTSPQELVSMIVKKAVKMADLMNVPVLALVENMSYFKCPDCGKEIKIFGDSKLDNIANENGIDTISRIPLDPSITSLSDKGEIENFEKDYLDNIVAKIKGLN